MSSGRTPRYSSSEVCYGLRTEHVATVNCGHLTLTSNGSGLDNSCRTSLTPLFCVCVTQSHILVAGTVYNDIL